MNTISFVAGLLGLGLAVGALLTAIYLYRLTTIQVRRLARVVFDTTSEVVRAMPFEESRVVEPEIDDDIDFTYSADESPKFVEPGKSTELRFTVMGEGMGVGDYICRVIDPQGRKYEQKELPTPGMGDTLRRDLSRRFPRCFYRA